MAETFVTLYQGNGGRVDIGYDYSQDIASNKTTLTVKAYVVKTNSSYYSYRDSPQTFTLTVNGVATTYGWTFNFSNMSLGTRYLITTAVRELTHNPDGAVAGIGASVYCPTGTDGLGTINGSTTISIPTIPRTSIATLNVSTQAIGGTIRVNTNRASGSFTHMIYSDFYDGFWTRIDPSPVGDYFDWVLPAALANKIPSATSGGGRIAVDTYSGSTYIGTSIVNFTATVPDTAGFRPIASGLSVTISGTGRDKTISKYVQGISKALMRFASTAYGGAGISSNSINIKRQSDNGNSMDVSGTSGTSGLLTLSGVYIITATTWDTRGRSHSITATITVDAYSVPTIASFTAARISPTTSVSTVRSGAYTYLGGSNTLSVVVSRAPRGGAFTALETTAGTTSGTFSGTYVSTGNTDTASYEFKLTITDQFGNTASATLTVPTAAVALTIKKDVGIGVGKVWEQGALDVAGDVYFNGLRQIYTNPMPAGNDSLAYWQSVKQGNYFCGPSTITNQPTPYGFVQVIRKGNGTSDDFNVMWFSQDTGKIYRKSGNSANSYAWVWLVSSTDILNMTYPVGAIYQSTVSTSPATLFGGTWVALGGKMLIGVDGTYTNGATGGSATHTLTIAQMPSHAHDTPSQMVNAAGAGTPAVAASGSSFGFGYGQGYQTTSSGGGQAHNNMPPYLAVYMWKRTA